MVYCVIAGCPNRSNSIGPKLRFFTFPKDEDLCKQWVSACGRRKAFKIECARICSEHFVQSDFKLQDVLLKVPEHKRRLQSGAVPSKNLPNEKRISNKEKKRRRLENKALVEECLASYERKHNKIKGEIKNCIDGNMQQVEEGLLAYVRPFLNDEKPLRNQTSETIDENYGDDTPNGEQLCAREIKCEKPLFSSHYNSYSTSNEDGYFLEKQLEEHSYSNVKYFTNGSTQTEFDYGCCKELHIMRLETQNRRLKTVIKKQAKRAQENETLRTSLRSIMTLGQINRLLHPGRNLKWRPEDIASAMSLYSAGPMAYALLRRKKFPLPSSSTLRLWAGKIETKPGILESVFKLMTKLDYTEKDRLCVLCFNKIRLKCTSYSDKSNNIAMTRAKYAYVVMARGLVRDWTQIIYYDLDSPISATVLKSIVVELDKIHFVVTAVISDMGPVVAPLSEELCVSENQPYFLHPCDEFKKIFFFLDVLRLIKLIRNRFVSSGFVLNGKTIDTKPIREILDTDKCELKISHEHLEADNHGSRKANFSAQLFSNSVANAIRKSLCLGKIQTFDALECADFISVVSDWYEIFNAKHASADTKKGVRPFGSNLENQRNILCAMSETVRNLKAQKRQIALRFQSGVLINNTALPEMLEYVKLNYDITTIMTDRLNHEELECFFDIMRAKGGPQDHPTPLEFKYRLRSSLLSKMIL